ncbi:O-antigen ligase family protein [Marinobacter sp. MMG032]|uniref:O-antigen ligase family protein n=1 Tax=Marinobacter sp. MMG032 TaxID=3158548 RepID=A0AAU7MQ51_9GAMM
MGKLIIYLLIFATGVSLFFAPWIAGIGYVLNSLLQPQYIWPWIFSGIPIFRITAALAILGLVFALVQKKASFSVYREHQNLMILCLWFWMHLSHLFSPFEGSPASVSPDVVLSTINSILIMYFVLVSLCRSESAIIYLCYIFVAIGVYYAYWANMAYINQEWYRFTNNRLNGPYRSPYQDGNVLSTLLVMCIPFIIFLYFRVKNFLLRTAIILTVPAVWHALVLFGSRGAFLASAITLLVSGYMISSRKIKVIIGVSFCCFMVYQGALLLDRAASTVAEDNVQTEGAINPRLISWEAGLKLIPEYPLFGVGVQMFEAAATSHFPGMTPHVAHNTFLNFSANTGLLTGLIFLALNYIAFRRLIRAKKIITSLADLSSFAVVASSISIIGFFVCSLFLDLIIFEPFYIAMIINILAYKRLENRERQAMMEKDE